MADPHDTTAAPKPKVEKVFEPAWAWAHVYDDDLTWRVIWHRAIITSRTTRGGEGLNQVTVECEGQKWRCYEFPDAWGLMTPIRRGVPYRFCRARDRPKVMRHLARERRRDAARKV
jgi:hypothetical protein